MFREMRRSGQQLAREECERILEQSTAGVLSVLGDDGYPYGVPLSYAYVDGSFVFHSAQSGHKVDAIRECSKASFTVIEQDEVVPDEFTTYYRSVIAFGKVRIVEDRNEKLDLLRKLSDRYWPDHDEEREAEIAPRLDHMHIIVMDVEHLSGKQARELVQSRQPK